MANGRTEDIKELYDLLERETNPDTRENIRFTIQSIKGESGSIRSMREALVRAHRRGDKEEIRDVHDYIKGKAKYGQ